MTLPFETARISRKHLNRRSFIGGSDARIIMGNDEPTLWREKPGEADPEDLHSWGSRLSPSIGAGSRASAAS